MKLVPKPFGVPARPVLSKPASKTMRIDLIPEIAAVPLGAAPKQMVVTATSRLARAARQTGILGAEYREFFQSVYDAGMITSAEGRVLDVNRRAVDFFRYAHEEFRGLHIWDLISGADSQLLTTLHSNLENERFTLIQAYCLCKSSDFFPAEIAVSRISLSGKRHLCFFVRDITVRRRAEDMLRTEHQAIQNASGGIAVTDVDGLLEYVNPAVLKLWGFPEDAQLISQPFELLMQNAEESGRMILQVVTTHNAWRGEMIAKAANGRFFPVDVSAICNRDSDGDAVGVVFSLADLTDHRIAEAARMEADRQKVMFESLGAVCHHLGQPLTVITGVLDILELALNADDEQNMSMLVMAQEACQSMSELLQRLREVQEYRTMAYLAGEPDAESANPNILDI